MLEKRPEVDWFVFLTTAVVIALTCVALIVAPDAGARVVDAAFAFITGKLGILYVWAGLATLGFLIWLACGKHGKITLGPANEAPAYGTASWAAMLFTAGIGTSIMHWGTIEWVYYYLTPP